MKEKGKGMRMETLRRRGGWLDFLPQYLMGKEIKWSGEGVGKGKGSKGKKERKMGRERSIWKKFN